MKMRRWLGIVLVPLLLLGCSYMLIQHGEVQQPLTEKIKAETVRERGLAFKSPVSIEYSHKEETKKLLRQIIERDYTPEEIINLQKAFIALGLLDKIDPNIDDLIDLYTEQAAGFYDPITKKLYLTDWLNKKDILVALLEFMMQVDLSGELLLSHELTHALQDQHYDLEKYIMEDKDNLDMILTRHAVSEGEATAVAFNVVARRFGKSVQDSPELPKMIQREADKFGSGLEGLSPIVREQLLFPYYGGLRFCRELLLAHGWEGFARLYQKPPRSTEQILHPEKYLKVLDEPKPIKNPRLEFLNKAGYQQIFSSTLGELGIQVMLAQYLSRKKSKHAAEGWGNDRYFVWEKTGGEEEEEKELSFVWVLVWDSALDAQEFFEAYCQMLPKRYKKEKFQFQEEKKNFAAGLTRQGRRIQVEMKDQSIRVVDGFSEDWTTKIAKVLTE